MAVTAPAPQALFTGREPSTMDFVRLKLRLMRNGFRGQKWRIALFVVGLVLAAWCSAARRSSPRGDGPGQGQGGHDVAYVSAVFVGAAVLLGWTLFPLLFFGVDETIDPARFALLPLSHRTLTRGMLASAFIGVPALMTFLATSGLVIAAALRFGLLSALVALVGVAAGLTLGVISSRAFTSAFAAMLRSRKMRDMAAVFIAAAASMIGPLQWLGIAIFAKGTVDQALAVARVLAWTPLAAPYVLPFDVAEGRWLAAAARLAMTLASIALLRRWWASTLESAMMAPRASARRPAAASARRTARWPP